MSKGIPLTQAEQKLIDAAKNGEPVDFRASTSETFDPDEASSWNVDRQIRGEILSKILKGEYGSFTPNHNGIIAFGVRVTDALDLDMATVPTPIVFVDCYFDEKIQIRGARLRTLTIRGGQIHGLNGEGARIDGMLRLGGQGFRSIGSVRLPSARIEGQLNLTGGKFENPRGEALNIDSASVIGNVLMLGGFSAKGEVRMLGAEFHGQLVCGGGTFDNPGGRALNADGMSARSDVFLNDGFVAKGEVILLGAQIGNLYCSGGAFENEDGFALSLDRASVRGNFVMSKGFIAKGEVRLLAARVGGQLVCNGGTFRNPGKHALSADGASIAGAFFLSEGFNIEGEVRLPGAEVGHVYFDDGLIENVGGFSFVADRVRVNGNFFLTNGLESKGEIRVLGAEIDGQLSFNGSILENPPGYALNADGISVRGDAFFAKGFTAKGGVRLLGAKIDGQLAFNGGSIDTLTGCALQADGVSVQGDFFLAGGFKAGGEVRLLGARIGGQFSCNSGVFNNPNGNALSADGASVKGNFSLADGFIANGEVRMLGCEIDGQLSCAKGAFRNRDGDALNATGVAVKGAVIVSRAKFDGMVDFSYASFGQLVDDVRSWPAKGRLILNGFSYESFAGNAPADASSRINWLRLQPMRPGEFWPQPYEQVIKVLRQMGHERDAKEVAIAKQEDLRLYGRLAWYAKASNWILGLLIGHGYKPWKALVGIAICVVLGWCAFQRANELGIMRPSKERLYVDSCFSDSGGACAARGWIPVLSYQGRHLGHYLPTDYPKFNAFWYSLDVFLPIVDLHQETYWQPTASNDDGASYRAFMWVFIILGWGLTTIFVVGLTGIVKKD